MRGGGRPPPEFPRLGGGPPGPGLLGMAGAGLPPPPAGGGGGALDCDCGAAFLGLLVGPGDGGDNLSVVKLKFNFANLIIIKEFQTLFYYFVTGCIYSFVNFLNLKLTFIFTKTQDFLEMSLFKHGEFL